MQSENATCSSTVSEECAASEVATTLPWGAEPGRTLGFIFRWKPSIFESTTCDSRLYHRSATGEARPHL
jgi:hypothetical protein